MDEKMTTVTGLPVTEEWACGKTDELARNAARNAVADRLYDRGEPGVVADGTADWVADAHTVTWERAVNANGVAVRRYVLRGAWEVDPEAVTP